MKIYLYIVACSDQSYYTGVTSHLERRIAEHNSGKNPEAYTFNRRPVELLFAAEYSDPFVAFEWEKAIKGWSRAKKEALIRGDWDMLQALSECRNFTHYKFKPDD